MLMSDIIDEIEELERIDLDKSFEYARVCSRYLRNPEQEDEGRRIIVNVLHNWDKVDLSTREMWTDLIESAGFYPYLEKEKKRVVFESTAGKIRKEFHKSSNLEEIYFHEEQKRLSDILQKGEKNIIVSAPTSFGKSLLIQEIVASKKYKNIVIIQPTLALIDETRKKLRRYESDYKIIVKTSQKPSNQKGNLFLLTAERIMEYSDFPEIDFFVLDEFYKLSAKRDEERSDILNNAFNYLVNKHQSKFYLLGPNIDDISKGFAGKFNAEFINTKYSLVDNRRIDKFKDFGDRKPKKSEKKAALFNLLLELKDEQTIIYCSSPQKVRDMAREFCNCLEKKGQNARTDELSIVEWMRANVGEKWSLINCLNHGIGIHDGCLQKHITSSIINYFNINELTYLFCTTTIIEGVNTSAKNVVYFDRTKGRGKPIDFFDYNNIKGRSGRMMVHYVGTIFNFSEPPEKRDVVIDVPFFEQKEVSDEVLINIDEKDIKNKESDQYRYLNAIPQEERELFKKNGVLVRGQKKILDQLMIDIHDKYESTVFWDNFPTYDQLRYVLSLAWDSLIRSGETTSPMTREKLIFVTHKYGEEKDIAQLVRSNCSYLRSQKSKGVTGYKDKTEEELFDDAVRDAFWTLRHWFHYKVPKWLNVMNSLQKFVCEKNHLKPGNYTFFSTQIENDFVRENLAILVEYGIPQSAIEKLGRRLPENLDEDCVLNEIENKNLVETSGLIEYEKEKIKENFVNTRMLNKKS
jgi:hypothetical protein